MMDKDDEDDDIICVICRVEDVKRSNEKKRITSRGEFLIDITLILSTKMFFSYP